MHTFLKQFENKVVVIAGGTSGIGEAIARQVSPVAKLVVILGRSQEAGKRLVERLDGYVIFKQLEMKDAEKVTETLNELNAQYGAIDYFFNLAGTFMAGEIRDTPARDWQRIFDNNILPIANGTAAIYEIMRANGRGHIVNVASAAGLFPVPVMNIYGATKSAVVSLTQGLRAEAKGFGIKVNVVCPTIVKTPLYDTAVYDGVDKTKALDILNHKLKAQTPELAAERILKGVARNRAVIHTASSTRVAWWAYRLSPALYMAIASRVFKMYREEMRNEP